MTQVLIVDDEPSICWGLEKLLTHEGFQVHVAGSAEKGLEIARQFPIDLILLDVRLPGMSGLEAMRSFHQATNQASVIVISAFGDLETALEVVKQGACDYLHKPFGLEEALAACHRALRLNRLNKENRHSDTGPSLPYDMDRKSRDSDELVGRSPSMQKVFRQIALVADSDLSVLITGETGTGKELVAAAIHRHSSRRSNPYVPVAPVTFSESLLESELFGHVRGAFTGASEDRAGLFETAGGGTILLDEIGDLPMSLQVKLLRVLEQRQFSRVGEIRNRLCDVRILSATHHDLPARVADHRFRQDLLYRLSATELHLPPLRDRLEDIEPLTLHFLQQIGYPSPQTAISDQLIDFLQSRPWPGNIRELRNAVERAAVIARGRALDFSDFASQPIPELRSKAADQVISAVLQWARGQLAASSKSKAGMAVESVDENSKNLYDRFLRLVEPTLLLAVLESVQGNRSAASDVLGMHRATLRERLRRYNME